jgi:hypothetical protein
MSAKQQRVRWVALGAVVGLALTAGGIGVASAVIPAPGGVVKACYKKNGNLRVLDSAATCKAGKETAISWNQTGPRGPSGVALTQSFGGHIANVVSGGSGYVFLGNPTSVMLPSQQTVLGSGSASLGTSGASAVVTDLDLCWQVGSGALNQFAATNFNTTYFVEGKQHSYSASDRVVLNAGSYNVGLCARPSVALDWNDYAVGWLMVTS